MCSGVPAKEGLDSDKSSRQGIGKVKERDTRCDATRCDVIAGNRKKWWWVEPTTDRGVSPALTHSDFVQKLQPLQAVLMGSVHQLSPWEHFLQMPILHYYSLVLLHTCISTHSIKGETPCRVWDCTQVPLFPYPACHSVTGLRPLFLYVAFVGSIQTRWASL